VYRNTTADVGIFDLDPDAGRSRSSMGTERSAVLWLIPRRMKSKDLGQIRLVSSVVNPTHGIGSGGLLQRPAAQCNRANRLLPGLILRFARVTTGGKSCCTTTVIRGHYGLELVCSFDHMGFTYHGAKWGIRLDERNANQH
jgi:hypothetical protein